MSENENGASATNADPAELGNESIPHTAAAWAQAGFCVMPLKPATKAPAIATWKQYVKAKGSTSVPAAPSPQIIDRWFHQPQHGLGLILGATSGNAEMFEFEGRAIAEGYLDRLAKLCQDNGAGEIWERLQQGYVELTPSGGVHYIFRVDGPVLGNTKLASRLSTQAELAANPQQLIQVLIETRGEGGFVVIAPSHLDNHGDWTTTAAPGVVVTLDAAERDLLYACARMLHDGPSEPLRPAREARVAAGRPDDPFSYTGPAGLSPFDDFSGRTDWKDILEPEGWQFVTHHGDRDMWLRPGKGFGQDWGWSASAGNGDGDHLWVWSTSTGLPTETTLSKEFVWAFYHAGGDLKAAAAALREQGYGARRQAAGSTALEAFEVIDETTGEIRHHDADGNRVSRTGQPWRSCDAFGRVEGEPMDELLGDPEYALCGHVRHFARARGLNPVALLAVVLTRLISVVPPNYVTPAIIGSYGSLNQYVCLVGRTGTKKSATLAAAAECVALRTSFVAGDGNTYEEDLFCAKIGSGQGVPIAFVHRNKPKRDDTGPGELVRDRYCAFIFCNEVTDLTAKANTAGSSLTATLCEAWVAEELGSLYRDPQTRLPVPAHTYRMGFVLLAQPTLLGPLLVDSEATGLPGRPSWHGVTDAFRPSERPVAPEPLRWTGPPRTDKRVVINVCDEAIRAIEDQDELSALELGDPLDGHKLFLRLKLAAALMWSRLSQHSKPGGIMSFEYLVTEKDWRYAGQLVELSDAKRAQVLHDLGDVVKVKAKARATAEVLTENLKDELRNDAVSSRTSDASEWLIGTEWKAGRLTGEWVAKRDLSALVPKRLRKLASEDAPPLDLALDALVASGLVENRVVSVEENHSQAEQYRRR